MVSTIFLFLVGRKIVEGLSNLTFASRQNGSYLMICRVEDGIWVSRTGLSTYNLLTDKRIYPDVAGQFEDPVIGGIPFSTI